MRKHKNKSNHPEAEREHHCLNCGTELKGNYCFECGQKANLHKDHFLHLIYEFAADYFHFDGRFFSTIKVLFTHPGLLTREYIIGKRKKYLNPIQMYIFVSACFFFLFSGFLKSDLEKNNVSHLQEYSSFYDSIRQEQIRTTKNEVYQSEFGFMLTDLGFCINNKAYTIHDYDSLEHLLPPEKRESAFNRKMHLNFLAINERTPDPRVISTEWLPEAFIHHLPKAFFILLPVFAFLLWLFYSKFPYADHIIFSIHFHIIIFLLLSICLPLNTWLPVGSQYGLLAVLFLYFYLSLKKVYQKQTLPTLIRWVMISSLYFSLFILVMVLLIVFSIFTI